MGQKVWYGLQQNMKPVTRLMCLAAVGLLVGSPPASAQTEARATALANSCKPTKIEVARQFHGASGETVYLVTCEHKVASSSGGDAPTLHIFCSGKLCVARK